MKKLILLFILLTSLLHGFSQYSYRTRVPKYYKLGEFYAENIIKARDGDIIGIYETRLFYYFVDGAIDPDDGLTVLEQPNSSYGRWFMMSSDISPNNELQTLSLAGSNLTLSNGGGTVSINDADASPTNEIQTLTYSAPNLSISGGNTVVISVGTSTEDANTNAFITSSTTPILVTGMSRTPAAGTYLVSFDTNAQFDSNNRLATVQIFVGGVAVATSARTSQFYDITRQKPLTTQARVTVNGSQAIEIRVNVSGGNITLGNKSLILVRTN